MKYFGLKTGKLQNPAWPEALLPSLHAIVSPLWRCYPILINLLPSSNFASTPARFVAFPKAISSIIQLSCLPGLHLPIPLGLAPLSSLIFQHTLSHTIPSPTPNSWNDQPSLAAYFKIVKLKLSF